MIILVGAGVCGELVSRLGAPFVLGFLTAFYAFELSLLVSLFVGGTLNATSIGITVRTLRDVQRQNSLFGTTWRITERLVLEYKT